MFGVLHLSFLDVFLASIAIIFHAAALAEMKLSSGKMTLNTKIFAFWPGLGDYGSYSHSLSVNEYKMSSSCFVSKHEELVG